MLREICTNASALHFRRWLLLSTPWGDVYLLHLLESVDILPITTPGTLSD